MDEPWDPVAALPTAGAAEPYLARVRALAPLIEGAAEEGEARRRLPERVVDALHEAGLYRLLLPRSLGGGEVDPLSFARVIEAVARHDASTAWCLCQAGGCSMSAAYLPPGTAWEIFGRDPRAVLAWGPGPGARAVAVDGGYRLTGRWSFASGIRQASWLGGHAPIHEPDGRPRRRADGRPEARTFLFPSAEARIEDVWQVSGLRATASDSFAVDGLFVPRERAILRDEPTERRHPGPLYCFPLGSLYASGFAGVALGLARSMLGAFVALARDKVARGMRRPLRESAVVQAEVAQAEARIGAARLFLMRSLEEIWAEVDRTGTLELAQRMRIRLAATWAINEAAQAATAIHHAAGAGAIFLSSAFDRRFRDIHAVTQQLQGRRQHFETVGQHLLGLEADTTFL
jgi:alkylation response protein AidB-like acyl-CoA dehydrogenase